MMETLVVEGLSETICCRFNLYLASIPILCPLKTPAFRCFQGYKLGRLAINGLTTTVLFGYPTSIFLSCK